MKWQKFELLKATTKEDELGNPVRSGWAVLYDGAGRRSPYNLRGTEAAGRELHKDVAVFITPAALTIAQDADAVRTEEGAFRITAAGAAPGRLTLIEAERIEEGET